MFAFADRAREFSRRLRLNIALGHKVAIKKSQLYSSLWKSCDELRGGMDASQYKDYVLTLLFMKYVSDKYANKPDPDIVIPEGGGFADMVKLKGDKEIGDKINKIIGKLADENGLKNVIDQADFNDDNKLGSGQAMVDRLTKLIGIFENLDFRANRADGDDLLGDAYEFLMRHFATESGKSKGQFYTPSEVSRIMAQVVGVREAKSRDQSIYDPTAGSGSLLLKAADEAPSGISIYGQEMDVATWSLARMNMILHGHETAELWRDNTLASPQFVDPNTPNKLKTFDFAVANPPFSTKSWTTGVNPQNDPFNRFHYGIPPEKNGDYAFLLHIISSLKSTGKGAVILPHGVLFRGNAEAAIRRNLVRNGLIKGIIGLPPNLFYGTGIPACIIVIDKAGAADRTGIFFVDASKGFVKDGNKNRLRAQDIHKIVDVFNNQIEQPRYSRLVPLDEIASAANDFNLNIPRYIDSSEPEDLQDLEAHLRGGIPEHDIDALHAYWEVFPSLRAELFEPGDRPGYCRAALTTQEIKPAILRHPEYEQFIARVGLILEEWSNAHRPLLENLDVGAKPKEIIEVLSEDLLRRLDGLPLLDKYDAYQRLMDYWSETMQDDLYLIAADGWIEAAKPRSTIDDKASDIKETPDLVVGSGKSARKLKMDLIPPALIAARFFPNELAHVADLEVRRDSATAELETFVEEHGGEDGLLENATNERGGVTRATVRDRLKIVNLESYGEEKAVLDQCLQLIDAEAEASRIHRDAQSSIDKLVLNRYQTLLESEIKSIVIDDKWFSAIQVMIDEDMQSRVQKLISRVGELETRYESPLSSLSQQCDLLSSRVVDHLMVMGIMVS